MIGNERRGKARLTFSLVLVSLSAAPTLAQEAQDTLASRTHVVRKGDTLWDIAQTYLADPFQWPRIYDLNTRIIADPHWIYPNQELVLPGSLLRRDAPLTVLGTPVDWGVPAESGDVLEEDERAMVIADLDLRQPVMNPVEYLGLPWLADPRSLPWAGRVVGVRDPALHEMNMPTMLRPYDNVHVGRLTQTVVPGDTLQVVRLGRVVSGVQQIVRPLALLEVDVVTEDGAIAHVVRMYGEARRDDPVLVLGALPQFAAGDPAPVQGGPEGQVLAMMEEQPLYGTTDIGFVTLGAGSVAIGDELEVYIPRQRVNAVDIEPAQRVGTVKVVRVEDRTATVRVTDVENAGLEAGLPVRLVQTIR